MAIGILFLLAIGLVAIVAIFAVGYLLNGKKRSGEER